MQKEIRQQSQQKQLKNLNLLDRFLFNEAIEDREFCRIMFSIILQDDNLSEITYGVTERELQAFYDTRAVRLDVLSRDAENTIYDVESQGYNPGFENLYKRSRYYQGQIDVNLLEVGETEFRKLNKTYIIFICPFDLFGQKKYLYTFRMRSDEDPGLILPDEQIHIYLNTRGENDTDVSPELIELLHFIEDTSVETNKYKSERVHILSDKVKKIKSDQGVGVRYMQLWEEFEYERREARAEGRAKGIAEGREEGREEGRAEGRAEGREEGLIEGIRFSLFAVLEKFGELPEDIIEKISLEKDCDILRRWIRAAISSETLGTFISELEK